VPPLALSLFMQIVIAWVAISLVVALMFGIMAARLRDGRRRTRWSDRRLRRRNRRSGEADRRVGLPDTRAAPVERRRGPADRRAEHERRRPSMA
jgi:hypothetical protein